MKKRPWLKCLIFGHKWRCFTADAKGEGMERIANILNGRNGMYCQRCGKVVSL